ncbi:hypothetical protein ITI46_11485 [Streptomyces oryzae]|uniref:Uncharacterized protein n=1 Tax=Streptomyces oryzae TaxID=1434886 RepID=A0ABS3XA96_9ACTN|nr:hypothetical protein [Streptomyces oryzae]MBO8192284.1 hypothetical protein [Streptomyces oryzae]
MTSRATEAEVQRLLYELCVDLGFCLPPQEQRRLYAAPPADPDTFTDAVFEAEGMNPAEHGPLRQQVREVAARHMGRWQPQPPSP